MSILSGKDDTKKGLSLLMFTMLSYGVLELLLAWQNISLAGAIEEETFSSRFCFIGCFAAILSLVAFLLLIAGAYKMYKGSKKQSPEHAKKVKIGVIILVFGFLSSFLIGGIISYFSPGFTEGGEYTSFIISSALIGAVSGILLMGGLLLLVYELAKDKQKKYILLIMGLYILMRIGYSFQLRTIPVEDETEMIVTLLRYTGIGAGLEALFSFTFAGIYYVVKGNYITKRSWDLDFDREPKEYRDEMDYTPNIWGEPQTTEDLLHEQRAPRKKLEELRDLKEDGLISEEEFKRKKEEILGKY